jgi:hypothetical protein
MTRSLPCPLPRFLHPGRLVASLMLAAASLPALAFNPQPDPPGRWSTVGLVMDQSVRLSVLAVPVGRDVPPDPCTVTFNFLDAYGQKLAETRTMVLLPGQMRFVDLKGSDQRLPNRTDRLQVRTRRACANAMAPLPRSRSSMPAAAAAWCCRGWPSFRQTRIERGGAHCTFDSSYDSSYDSKIGLEIQPTSSHLKPGRSETLRRLL